MTQAEHIQAAKDFAGFWANKGDEKQESQRFWIQLLGNVLGIPDPASYIEFEKPNGEPRQPLADLYDETFMPADFRAAHRENDKAVMTAYGFGMKMTESECVAELFKLYEKLSASS